MSSFFGLKDGRANPRRQAAFRVRPSHFDLRMVGLSWYEACYNVLDIDPGKLVEQMAVDACDEMGNQQVTDDAICTELGWRLGGPNFQRNLGMTVFRSPTLMTSACQSCNSVIASSPRRATWSSSRIEFGNPPEPLSGPSAR